MGRVSRVRYLLRCRGGGGKRKKRVLESLSKGPGLVELWSMKMGKATRGIDWKEDAWFGAFGILRNSTLQLCV